MRSLKTLVVALIVAAPLPAFADGLIYSLPKDGSKIVYEMKGNKTDKNNSRDFDGTLSIASVGRETVDNEKYRWIEVVMQTNFNGMGRKMSAKMLILESDIGVDKIPLGNLKRAWIKSGNRKPDKVDDLYSRKGGPLPAFLPAPLSETKKLAAAEITSDAGKFQCAGLTGKSQYEQSVGQRTDLFKIDYEIRRSDKVPFGVVSAKMTIKEFIERTRLDDTITLEFKLKSIEKNAKTTISEGK